jgi:phytoene synthase
MTPLDPDRALALAYVPKGRRAGVEALWRLDAALGAVRAGGREPLISRIKLVWWRDSLEKLDRDPAPAEPTLEAVAAAVLPHVSGADLAAMEQGWTALLEEGPLTAEGLNLYAERGRLLFRHSATLLGGPSGEEVEQAGALWALADLARHSGEPDASAALAAARDQARSLAAWTWPRALRPLGMLASLADRDAGRGLPPEPQGSPGRMLMMLGHRLTGR